MTAVADPLRVLQASTATAAGLEYFKALARGFAEAFGMRVALVGRLVPGTDAVDVLALWTGDGFLDNFRYDLEGTPCREIVRRDVCQIVSGVAAAFPRDTLLAEHGIESYIGVPLRGEGGEVVGLLAALDQNKRSPDPALVNCVRPFADRAAWLIERVALERRLRQEASRASALATIAAILQYKNMSASSFDDVCTIACDTLDADTGSVWIVDPTHGDMVRRGSVRQSDSWRGIVRAPQSFVDGGLPPGDVVQLNRDELIAAMDRPQLIEEQQTALFARARHDGRLIGVIAVYSNRPGHRWQPDEEAWLAGVSGLISQALVNARLVEALRTSEARFRGIVATGLEGVLTLDADHTITFANPQAGELLGRDAEVLPGLSAREFLPADRLEQLRGGGRLRLEVRLGARTVVVSAAPLCDAARAHAGATVLLADITETRALADRVAQLEKIESLAVLAGGVAHDFNNLLAAVLGNLELARQRTGPGSPAQPFLAEVDAAARRAAELTQQMLTYAGRSRTSVGRLDLGHLLAELRAELRRCAGAHPLQIAAGPGLAVDGDAAQLRQLVLNLIRNAAEALDGREGTIHLELSTRRVDAGAHGPGTVGDARDGTFAALSIRDTGCGIEPAIFPRIFDPFFSTKFTGRGLGLSAALGIVRAHHGSITVASTPGHGSTFTVLLPLADGPAPARKVLVVDDDPDVLALSARVLGGAGYEVVRARGGATALERFAEGGGAEFVAVLLDMAMPGLDGAETFARLRRIRDDVAVIFTSGYDEAAILDRLDGAAPAGFLQKPWTSESLLRAVRTAAS